VTTGDLDGDQDLDVLSASAGSDTVAYYTNNGNRPFTQNVITETAEWVVSVATADLDGDQHLDVLSASADDDTVAWYQNDGSTPPRFTKLVITDEARYAQSIAIADLDGDADLDVISASQDDDTVAWYANRCVANTKSSGDGGNDDDDEEATNVLGICLGVLAGVVLVVVAAALWQQSFSRPRKLHKNQMIELHAVSEILLAHDTTVRPQQSPVV